jgi:hypothetical protein
LDTPVNKKKNKRNKPINTVIQLVKKAQAEHKVWKLNKVKRSTLERK